MKRWGLLAGIGLAALLSACSVMHSIFPRSRPRDEPPPAAREFRAAWVATVKNIDWPSKPGLSTEQQKNEAMKIIDTTQSLHLNAIILQVRTSCDALYASQIEPWSKYLTGKQGQAPEPYYDPLQFWIEQCHARGIQLHAWINPFRADVGTNRAALAPNHVGRRRPWLVKKYGRYLWLDPGWPEARDYTFNVVMDIVRRYDIDGIHIDDYFYPYPERSRVKGQPPREIPFPDDDSYDAYRASGGKLSRPDWRRDNINRMIHRLYNGIHARKPWVQFGISPFGIARPGKPSYVRGFDQYDRLYADPELWLKNGWCDYMAPQLYWPIGAPHQPYLGLLQWWLAHNPRHRHIYPGIFTSRINGSRKSWCPSEILGQVEITKLVDPAGGNIHFSAIALVQNRKGIADDLRKGLYADEALIPATPWLDDQAPAAPLDLTVNRATQKPSSNHAATTGSTQPATAHSRLQISWKPAGGEKAWQYTVYIKRGNTWKMSIIPGDQTAASIDDPLAKGAATKVAVAAVDRSGNESARTIAAVPTR